MDIRKIEAFSKVYEHSSFSKAGKALYLSQPTISAHVASLEQELEVQLFDRIGRSVVPTKAGEVLYRHAQKIFEASELAISELRKLQDRITGTWARPGMKSMAISMPRRMVSGNGRERVASARSSFSDSSTSG